MSTQDNRFVSVTTPLGKDILLFSRMSGYEELGRLFEYEVDLLIDDANKGIVNAGFPTNKVLGQAMIIAMDLPKGGKRYFHGLVTQFRHHGTMEGFYLFRAVLRPWLWFLTRTSDCRIFQELPVPDIIKQVFSDNGFTDFKLELTRTYKPRSYCVQYRESDFNFVSRLMEHEGIFYYFKHEQSKHTLVIGDSVNAYQTIADYETVPYFPPENTGQRQRDHIHEWHTAHKVQSGAYVLNDYDYKKPKSNLVTKYAQPKPHSHAEGEQYDYPGSYFEPPVGDTYANIRLDELQTEFEVMQGSGDAMGLTTGMLFTLKDHYISPENTKHILITNNFTIVNNQYRSTAIEETQFESNFKVIRATQQFRPQRLTPVPFVQGPQTATVVGKAGEEIWTDQYGRVKVQFHWDREGKMDESSSCWVRVSHPWAGKNWGAISIPRIGQEVIVDFLEGNPDRPIITGRVYNAMQMPPYELPAAAVISGIKSNTHKGKGYNEMSMDDTARKEKITIHAQYDMGTTVEHDDTQTVHNDRTINVDGTHTETIKKDTKITISEGSYTHTVVANHATHTTNQQIVITSETAHIHITASTNIKLEVGAGKLQMFDDGRIELSGKNITIKGSESVNIKGGSVRSEADTEHETKGAIVKSEGSATNTVKGGMVMLNP